MSGPAGRWCLIESDPGVFSDMIRRFGVEGIQVEELYSLDEDQFAQFSSVYGLIFLFKVDQTLTGISDGNMVQDSRSNEIYFSKQVIENACATQAILSVLMNVSSESADVKLGETLGGLKSFCTGMDPQTRGLALSNSDEILNVHNSFARQNLFDFEEIIPQKDGQDSFHFIAYVPINGRVYELDGLQEGPIDHGAISGDRNDAKAWISAVRPVIQRRIERYQKGEIHFNLMALVPDKLMACERRLIELQTADPSSTEIELIKQQIADENKQRTKQRVDNIRRRHNFLPFIVELLKILAEKGQLVPLLQKQIAEDKAKKETKTSEPSS